MESSNGYQQQTYATLEELEILQILVQLLEMPSNNPNIQAQSTSAISNTEPHSMGSYLKPNSKQSKKRRNQYNGDEFKELVVSTMSYLLETNPNFAPRKCTKYSAKSTPYDGMKQSFLL